MTTPIIQFVNIKKKDNTELDNNINIMRFKYYDKDNQFKFNDVKENFKDLKLFFNDKFKNNNDIEVKFTVGLYTKNNISISDFIGIDDEYTKAYFETGISDNIEIIFDENEKFKYFNIDVYISNKNENLPMRGDDDNSYCFYKCNALLNLFPICGYNNYKELIKKFPCALNQNGDVYLQDMPRIEELFKIGYNITGEVNYSSMYNDKKYDNKIIKIVNLICTKSDNGCLHLEPDYELRKEDKNHKICFYKYDKERPIIINYKSKLNNYSYDGTKFIINPIEIKDNKKIKIMNKNYINIDLKNIKFLLKDKVINDDNIKDKIKEAYVLYNKEIDKLLLLDEKNLNLKKTGNITNTIRFIINCRCNKLNINNQSESVNTLQEFNILEKATKGGIRKIFCKRVDENGNKIIYKNVFTYDIKSDFPYVLSHKDFLIPIKSGIFKHIEKKYFDLSINNKKMLQYGIYSCKIKKNEKSSIYFIENLNNEYTHYDIYLACLMNMTIELIDDKPFNCIVWYKIGSKNIKQSLIHGSDIFKSYNYKYYHLKNHNKDCKLIKQISSLSWSALCEKNKSTRITKVNNNNIDIELKNDEIIYKLGEDIDNVVKYETMNKTNFYKSNYARFKPFMYSFQRLQMYEYINQVKEEGGEILKINIDAIYTNNKIKKFEDNTEFYNEMMKMNTYKDSYATIGLMCFEKFNEEITF
jgi:hypothetical protein